MEYRGNKVKFVRNITDVDDKIINKAKEEFPGEHLNSAVEKVSEKYLKAYHDDMKALRIEPPTNEPKATKYIRKMIKFIEILLERGVAYEVEGDVYFNIKKAKDYGKLSHQNMENIQAGARIAPGEKKNDPLDFALWKSAKEGEPSWESPWGKGRPGWHIECSVMSLDILGDEFDIHGGGIDLIFPHHENEVAQSEGAGKKFARYWIHNGLLTINSEKMAKSLGNFITIKDFIQKYNNADFLKMFFLSTHYSHPVDYTEDKIKEARQSLDRIARFLEKARCRGLKKYNNISIKEIEDIKNKFIEAMDDDFNAPKGLSCIFDLVNLANKNIEDKNFVCAAESVLKELLDIFGISLHAESTKDKEIEEMIQARNKARKDKDYQLSDKIRKELEEKGVILEDLKEGTTWRRKI